MSVRKAIREMEHALSDLRHEAFPDYAATWQDDIECALVHAQNAAVTLGDLVASWGPSKERRQHKGVVGDRQRRDDP